MKLSCQSFLVITLILASCDSKERRVDANDGVQPDPGNQKSEGETANVESRSSTVEALPQNQDDGSKEKSLLLEIANLDRRITLDTEMVSYYESSLKRGREEVGDNEVAMTAQQRADALAVLEKDLQHIKDKLRQAQERRDDLRKQLERPR